MKKYILVILMMLCLCGCNSDKENVNSTHDGLIASDIENEGIEKEYDCSFTKTYRIIETLEDYGSATNTFYYVVGDVFQSFTPEILLVPLKYEDKLDEDEAYEFTYTLKGKGIINDMDDVNDYFINTTINNRESPTSLEVSIDVRRTDKTGLEQINEDICG